MLQTGKRAILIYNDRQRQGPSSNYKKLNNIHKVVYNGFDIIAELVCHIFTAELDLGLLYMG